MFSSVHLENFGAFSEFTWSDLGRVNVVVGENDTGKSHLLKAIYVIARSIEAEQKPAGSKSSWAFKVSSKLRWTFQPRGGLGVLIRHGAPSAEMTTIFRGRKYSFGWKQIDDTHNRLWSKKGRLPKEDVKPIFIPPKEILTTFSAIAATRESLEIYGFDDTYYDLVKLLRTPPTRGTIAPHLLEVLKVLRDLFGGTIIKSPSSDDFSFRRGQRAYAMPQTADGIKKIGILARLIRNRSLKPGAILFLDEPETNLHPKAISHFTRMLFLLGLSGVQVFVATHSYFVIKQLQILAKQHDESVPFCSLIRTGEDVEAQISDLRDGMPDNPIVDESVRMYQEELEVDLGERKKVRGS